MRSLPTIERRASPLVGLRRRQWLAAWLQDRRRGRMGVTTGFGAPVPQAESCLVYYDAATMSGTSLPNQGTLGAAANATWPASAFVDYFTDASARTFPAINTEFTQVWPPAEVCAVDLSANLVRGTLAAKLFVSSDAPPVNEESPSCVMLPAGYNPADTTFDGWCWPLLVGARMSGYAYGGIYVVTPTAADNFYWECYDGVAYVDDASHWLVVTYDDTLGAAGTRAYVDGAEISLSELWGGSGTWYNGTLNRLVVQGGNFPLEKWALFDAVLTPAEVAELSTL